jgi:hypothetical protein
VPEPIEVLHDIGRCGVAVEMVFQGELAVDFGGVGNMRVFVGRSRACS